MQETTIRVPIGVSRAIETNCIYEKAEDRPNNIILNPEPKTPECATLGIKEDEKE